MIILPRLRSKLSTSLIALLSTIAVLILCIRVRSFSSYSGTAKTSSMPSSSTTSSLPAHIHWTPLGLSNFPSVTSSEDECRYAKDDEYLEAVLDSWKQDIDTALSPQRVETLPWIYHDNDQTPLYGHIVRPIVAKDNHTLADKNQDVAGDDGRSRLRPGILLFHTAAGPQDVFLFQKAAKLASSELGCVVFITDVLSDPDGWAWSPNGDRTRYNEVRQRLLQDNGRLLRSRVKAAIRALINGRSVDDDNILGVDPKRLAGIGWCLGAQPILELATLQQQEDKKSEGKDDTDNADFSAVALVSYHGVYHRDPPQPPDLSPAAIENEKVHQEQEHEQQQRDVLICTGKSDPFVSQDDLEFARTTMEEKMYNVKIIEFDGAKHGFTNPAQDFNTNEAFAYNEYAAKESWEETMELLKRRLL